MIWILSFVPVWLWAIIGVAAVVAARFYLGERVMFAAIAIFGFVAAFQTGVRYERQKGEAFTLRQEVTKLNLDIANAKSSKLLQEQRLEEVAAAAGDRQAQVAKLEKDLADERRKKQAANQTAKPGTQCDCGYLSADDIRRLPHFRKRK